MDSKEKHPTHIRGETKQIERGTSSMTNTQKDDIMFNRAYSPTPEGGINVFGRVEKVIQGHRNINSKLPSMGKNTPFILSLLLNDEGGMTV